MIKNLKLNIKNAQLAEALKKTGKSLDGAKSKLKKSSARNSIDENAVSVAEPVNKSSSKKTLLAKVSGGTTHAPKSSTAPRLLDSDAGEMSAGDVARPKVQLLKKGRSRAASKDAGVDKVAAGQSQSERLATPVEEMSTSSSLLSPDSLEEGVGVESSTPQVEEVTTETPLGQSSNSADAAASPQISQSPLAETSTQLEGKEPESSVSSERQHERQHDASSATLSRSASADEGNQEASATVPRRNSFERKPGLKLRETFSARLQRQDAQRQQATQQHVSQRQVAPRVRLGPTGRHIDDIRAETAQADAKAASGKTFSPRTNSGADASFAEPQIHAQSKNKTSAKEFDRKENRGLKRTEKAGRVSIQRAMDEDSRWRKRRTKKSKGSSEDTTIRPSSLQVRLPITIKDLASSMKLKASELISKLFLQGVAKTLNDVLDDETTVQLLGQEFGCEITVDTSEEERIAVTSQSIREEIAGSHESERVRRPPVIAFMGHVDHGKTSLIDKIRSSNRVDGEAGAITQHIAAFSCQTTHGQLTILDTPGHAAFEEMRSRGASLTDVIVLVVAGDDGIMPQTDEAIKHAKNVGATIVVAINKSDKPSFNVDNVYRQLSERELLPEAWGGHTITINCSAVSGEGVNELLEMVALQCEVLELGAVPSMRARGTVIEAELHKGLGNVATVLVQNGSLRMGDPLVFASSWGRVRTLRDEHNQDVDSVGPGHPALITGLESLPSAGEEFVVVESEREARDIASARLELINEKRLSMGRRSLDALFKQAQGGKKVVNAILRADVQGSLEALRVALVNIDSEKVDVKIISDGIGEISESDVELAAASEAVVFGFHTQIEPRANDLIKEKGVTVKCYDVIYHAVDGMKDVMVGVLDKIAEEVELGVAEIKAIFKSSHTGNIAGCMILDGKVERGCRARVTRAGETLWEGSISSLRRDRDDVRSVTKGFECGIVLDGYKEIQEGDRIECYSITYKTQEL